MPKTRVEYATDQITVYRGCEYNCKYCWAWRHPLFRRRILRGKYDAVREARRYLDPRLYRRRGKLTIVVSFTSDPYPSVEEKLRLTRAVLEVLSLARKHRVMILTKNPMLALRDIDLMRKHGDMWLGATVISLEKNRYEPDAPDPLERIKALAIARAYGVKTWVSIEPIMPKVTNPLEIVRATEGFVDFYVLGALSYPWIIDDGKDLYCGSVGKAILRSHYDEVVPEAIEYMRRRKKSFHIKNNLREFIGDRYGA